MKKNSRWFRCAALLLLTAQFSNAVVVRAQTTNNVTAGNTIDYTINGLPDPPFTFQRGVTYVFVVGVVGHPFWIKSVLGGNLSGGAGAFNTGVLNNGAQSGSVVFNVPASAPNQLFYQCGLHAAMSGVLTIVDPPAQPPTVKIVFINVADFITVKSTGTNGWSAVPEFRCGSDGTNWTALAAGQFTNSFANNTNTTTFPRLEAVCGSTNVLLRIRNQQP